MWLLTADSLRSASMVCKYGLQNADVIMLANAEGNNTELTWNFKRKILEKQSCTPMNFTLLRGPLTRRARVLRWNWSIITTWPLYPQILNFILIVLISRLAFASCTEFVNEKLSVDAPQLCINTATLTYFISQSLGKFPLSLDVHHRSFVRNIPNLLPQCIEKNFPALLMLL